MLRIRSGAIVIQNNSLLLMYRNKDGDEYYTFIGGGVEPDETPEQAVVREVYEESSLQVTSEKLLYKVQQENGDVQYFYFCQYESGVPTLNEKSNEYKANSSAKNTYQPLWVPLQDIDSLVLYPDILKQRIRRDIENNFSDCPTSL